MTEWCVDDWAPVGCDYCGRRIEFESELYTCDHCDLEGCERCFRIEDDAVGVECPGCRGRA